MPHATHPTLFSKPRKACCSRDTKLKDIGVDFSGTVYEVGPNDDGPEHGRAARVRPYFAKKLVPLGCQPPPVKPEVIDDMPPGMGDWCEWTEADDRVE